MMFQIKKNGRFSQITSFLMGLVMLIGLISLQGCEDKIDRALCMYGIKNHQSQVKMLNNGTLPFTEIPGLVYYILENSGYRCWYNQQETYYRHLGITRKALESKVGPSQLLYLWERLRDYPERCYGETRDDLIVSSDDRGDWDGWNETKTPEELAVGIEKLSAKYPKPLGRELGKNQSFSYYIGIWPQNAYRRMAYACLLQLRSKNARGELIYPESKRLIKKIRDHLSKAHNDPSSIDSSEAELKSYSREIPPGINILIKPVEKK